MRDAFDLLRRGWDDQVGDAIPIPPSRPVSDAPYRIRIRHSKVAGAVVEEIFSDSIVGGTGGNSNHLNDRVVLHLVRTGTWNFARSGGRGASMVVPAGRFIALYNDPSWRFGIGARTNSRVLILPPGELQQLVADKPVTGPFDAAPMRVLMAHVDTVSLMLDDLPPTGVRAAQAATTELVTGVVAGTVDGNEPLLGPALAVAAQRLVEGLLTDAELSPQLGSVS
ncbi:hypothetical protein ABZ883_42500 [Streptomyces sp. NPDC046977]|uniref:hypothetical protein n=1 Tax=Streptomyces sp. NPDC046977 TaxID=3154703 RepID=UPI0033C0C8DF